MSLIISLGTNLGNKKGNLKIATHELRKKYTLIAKSSIFSSPAVDYENQPDFYNQILEFQLPKDNPQTVITDILNLEIRLGRTREIEKGPRTIDIDILFWKTDKINTESLVVPHPRLFERSFICLPLQEIPYYITLSKHFNFPTQFNNSASSLHTK